MGRSGSGKSSMRSIIFSNYSAYETQRLGATIDVEHSHLRFLGNMTLNLWDCGGQDVFVQNYFTTQRDHIFRMVEVLIHVFDVQSQEVQKDIATFVQCLRHLREFSPNARVFVLVHKMDLVHKEQRPKVFNAMMTYLNQQSNPYGYELMGFSTSIWDESLFKAWSQIVCSLIPNMSLFQRHLQKFADISEAEEVVLFERTTFLVISHVSSLAERQKKMLQNYDKKNKDTIDGNSNNGSSNNNNNSYDSQNGINGNNNFTENHLYNGLDPKRFEKISNIIKTYKQSCSKMRAHLQTLTLHGSNCSAYIDNLTNNTFIMVVMPPGDPTDGGNTIVANIKGAREWFERIELVDA